MLAWLSVWGEVQTCICSSWCHCHLLSLASVKSRLVLPFWYQLTWVVPEKWPLNGCLCVCVHCYNYNWRIALDASAWEWRWRSHVQFLRLNARHDPATTTDDWPKLCSLGNPLPAHHSRVSPPYCSSVVFWCVGDVVINFDNTLRFIQVYCWEL